MGTTAILVLVLGTVFGLCIARIPEDARFRRAGETFPCRVRPLSDLSRRRWLTRGPSVARWFHSVLVIRSGWVVARTYPFPIRSCEDVVTGASGARVRGDRSVTMRFTLDDGTGIEVVAPRRSREALGGPFVVPILPVAARRERPPRRR